MLKIRLYGTTSAGGDLTIGGTGSNFAEALGLLYAAQLVDGALADGVDITITCENSDMAIPLLVKADFNSDQITFPRVAEASIADGSALTSTTMPVVNGIPKMVIAQDGNAVAGGCILYILD